VNLEPESRESTSIKWSQHLHFYQGQLTWLQFRQFDWLYFKK
jgi:hypothetical protein